MFIAEFGSGNSCRDDLGIVREMIDSVKGYDLIIKWQLFLEALPNEPLKREVFRYAYEYATEQGIKTTASVFDIDSLHFLQEFEDIPFIKIANNQKYYKLASGIDTPLVISYPSIAEMGKRKSIKPLCCVSSYPAETIAYEKRFSKYWLSQGISDHTEGFELYHKYKPEIFEKHFVLKHDKNNPDGGMFAMTPDDLGELNGTKNTNKRASTIRKRVAKQRTTVSKNPLSDN
jgi:sialic acid synthase SpsE